MSHIDYINIHTINMSIYSEKFKNDILNGNRGAHMTFVWTWRRNKQSLNFCRTLHQFIQHYGANAVHGRTFRSPDVTFLRQAVFKQAGWYGLSEFELSATVHLCIQDVTRAWLFAKWTTHLNIPSCISECRTFNYSTKRYNILLLYLALFFFSRSTCVIADTCKSHDFIPSMISHLLHIITWWWVPYSCRNSLLRQKSPCFVRKSPSGNSYCWIYPPIQNI